MPTVRRIGGYEFVIYLRDHTPAHVHVFAQECEAVINLDCTGGLPTLRETYQCKRPALKEALRLVTHYHALLCSAWKEIHGNV